MPLFPRCVTRLSSGVSLEKRPKGRFVVYLFQAPRNAAFGHYKDPVAKLHELFKLR
jgi:hypothetical protein